MSQPSDPNLLRPMTKADSSQTSETKGLRQVPPAQGRTLTPTTRVDAPHEMAASVSGAGPEAPPPDDTPAEQLRLQALQLATYLRGRQKELDAREAELNSHIACCESEARTARLWLEQRRADLDAENAALVGQRQELTARVTTLDDREEELARRQRIMSDQEQALLQRQQKLSLREQEFEERLERLAVAESARETNAQATAERCADVQRQVAVGERLATEHRREMADLERKRQTVQRRAEHVDKCRASLKQLRDELVRMHRETLEIRLATEELWVQLSGAAPPAALTRSLGRIRTGLAEQYTQANAELVEQKKELETIRGQLDSQLSKLIEHKRQLEQWAAGRERDCESQASRLIAREEQLQREEDHLREQAKDWQAERLGFQQELRRWKANRFTRRRGNAAPAC